MKEKEFRVDQKFGTWLINNLVDDPMNDLRESSERLFHLHLQTKLGNVVLGTQTREDREEWANVLMGSLPAESSSSNLSFFHFTLLICTFNLPLSLNLLLASLFLLVCPFCHLSFFPLVSLHHPLPCFE